MMANFSVPYKVTLGDILPNEISNPVLGKLAICGLDNNSRTIEEGDVFFAYPGTTGDGRDYIDSAILRGAAAVMYEAADYNISQTRKRDCVDVNQQSVPVIPVANLAQQLSDISARYFAQPSAAMACIGVTGTNGKTTCAYWLAQLLQKLGKKSGLIGTLGHRVFDGSQDAVMEETGFTTPDAIRLQNILFGFKQKQVSHTVMEVSSHSLDQGRVSSIHFSTALFTNLSRDHLDYHGTMESYGAAKARLFRSGGLQHAVINLDDSFGCDLATQVKIASLIRYSVSNSAADVFIRNLTMDHRGILGHLVTPWGEAELFSSVVGDFNVSNLLGVISVLCAEGFDFYKVVDAVRNLEAPPGRLQRISLNNADKIAVFVDFAHTPDALEKVLSTLKAQSSGKLWCVFGCGGDRDSGKRPVMGEIVSRLADHCVVTSDNPRSENPQDIIRQILSGMDKAKTIAIENRKLAIVHAVKSAAAGDVVLVAGKGHEAYQEVQGIKLPFSDVSEALLSLRLREQNKPGGRA